MNHAFMIYPCVTAECCHHWGTGLPEPCLWHERLNKTQFINLSNDQFFQFRVEAADYSATTPTVPYVTYSVIRFLGYHQQGTVFGI